MNNCCCDWADIVDSLRTMNTFAVDGLKETSIFTFCPLFHSHFIISLHAFFIVSSRITQWKNRIGWPNAVIVQWLLYIERKKGKWRKSFLHENRSFCLFGLSFSLFIDTFVAESSQYWQLCTILCFICVYLIYNIFAFSPLALRWYSERKYSVSLSLSRPWHNIHVMQCMQCILNSNCHCPLSLLLFDAWQRTVYFGVLFDYIIMHYILQGHDGLFFIIPAFYIRHYKGFFPDCSISLAHAYATVCIRVRFFSLLLLKFTFVPNATKMREISQTNKGEQRSTLVLIY